MIPRPKRAEGKVRVDETAPPAQQPAAEQSPVALKQKKGLSVGSFIKGAIGLIILLVTIAAAAFVIITATIATVQPINDKTYVVVRGAYPLGQYPAGAVAAVNPGVVDRSVLGNVDDLLGIPGISVVEIIGGPFGQLTTDADGFVAIDGVATSIKATIPPQVLDNAYFVKCVSGDCGEPGSLTFVPTDYIIGGVKGELTGEGLKEVEIPEQLPQEGAALMWTDR